MSYRRRVPSWFLAGLAGVGIGLLTVAVPALLRSTAAAPVAAAPLPTQEQAAITARDARLAVLEEQMERRMAELERRVWELEYLRTQLEQIADLVPAEYRLMTVEVAREYGLDPRALAALGWVESRWDPDTIGSSGEIGLVQVLPSTGEWIAEQLGIAEYDLSDPRTNLEFGAQYLVWLIEEHGSIDAAFMAYNAGPMYETRAPLAARAYVDRIRTAMASTN